MKLTKVNSPINYIEFNCIEVGQFFLFPGIDELFLKINRTAYIRFSKDRSPIVYDYNGSAKVFPIEIVEIQYRLKD